MRTTPFLPSILAGLILLPMGADAQEPSWNRKFQAMAVTPDVAGGSVVSAVFSIDAQPSAVPLDLSTRAVLHLNGVPVDSLDESVSFDVVTVPCGVAACSGVCGNATLAAGAATLDCYEDSPWNGTQPIEPGADCDCGIWRSITFPAITVSTGDEIMVILRPAPGALPDPDTSDDMRIATPDGEILYWNRSVESAQMFDVGGGNYDIVAWGDVAYNGPQTINLDFDLVVRRNGVDVVEQAVSMRGGRDATDPTCFELGCGNYCGVINGTARSCLQAGPWNTCSCHAGWIETIPGVPIPNLQTGDEIMVILRPAPGAIPETPPTQFDDFFITPHPQAEPSWDRKMQHVAILPDGSGGWTVSAHWSIDAQPGTVPLDLSTQVEVQINGSPIFTFPDMEVLFNQVDPSCSSTGCSGTCGNATLDGGAASLVCYEDCPWHATPGIQDCDCGVWLSWETPSLPTVVVGDEIMVILRPAPGALPDADTSNDSLPTRFDGGEVFWNRAITTAELDWLGDGTYDLTVGGHVVMDGVSAANLDFDIVVLRNGMEEFSFPMEQRMLGGTDVTCFEVGCGQYCGSRNSIDLTCDTSGPWSSCRCGGSWLESFTGVLPDASFGDEIMVILRPAPGALPELPGIPGNDDNRLADRVSGVEDDVVTLSPRRLLAQNTPNPFNPRTEIAFILTERGFARLEIFDSQGRRVRTLVAEVLTAGEHRRSWDGRNDAGLRMASGIYSYRLSLENGWQETRKMVLIK